MMASSEKNPLDSTDEEKQTKENASASNEPESEKVYQPEPENEQMVVKPQCECLACQHWTTSVDWCPTPNLNFECNRKKNPHKEKKLQPLLRSEKYPGKGPKIFAYKPENLTKVEKQAASRTLVHGEVIPQPVKMFTETYFSKDIQLSLEALNYRYSLPLQSFVWPAIFRQMNVFMIGGPKSGKTLAYLPAMCTFATMVDDRYEELAKHKGPLVVIICSNSKQCEEIFDLIKKLYNNINIKPKVSIMTYPITNVHSTDILITIPDSLIHCLKSRIFNFKRLCHLVLEDTSSLLKNFESQIYKIFMVVDEMLIHRANNKKVQLIVTSEKWSTDLKKLLKSVYTTPVVCIGNYLEAALYGNIQFEIKFLMSYQKLEYLQGILQEKYRMHKTIIICNNSEITEVSKWLACNGIATITLSDSSSKEEIEDYEIEWSVAQGGKYKVLLCTDFIFDSLLCSNDAMWLVNYSFSATWTRFTKRFSALSSYYKSPLESKEGGIQSKSFVLIDETCEEQMGKILNLLGRLTKEMPANYQTYADGFKSRTENEKIDTGVSLCETLKLFGKCSNSLCEKRHLVREALDISDDIPKSGKVVFKILNMKNVSQYSVQLLEHIDLNGHVREISTVDLKKPLVYTCGVEPKRAEHITIGEFYAHCDHTTEGEVYTLCHVIKIQKDNVDVFLTTGVTLQTLKTKLFEVPPDLNIVDVYLCNLVPPFRDEYFSGRSFHAARTSLENIEHRNIVFTGTIFLQLSETLWLDKVVQMFNVDGTDIIKFNLTKHLINLQVVEPSTTQITSLHRLCAKCDIALPTYVKQIAKKPARSKETEPQRAFLDDNINEVILSSAVTPDEFYVRLVKYQTLLENLESEIETAVKTEILDKNINVEIGKYYLALEPNGQNYARTKILNVENDKALCFYVDYGDEAIVDVKTLKILPSKFLTKLPFQAIQCRLYGLCPAFGEWDDESTEVLYKYVLEPDTDIFRSLFLDVRAKDDGDAIRAKVKYSVLLKDGYGTKNVLINQLLLDCGFATSIFDKMDDFEIPRPEEVEESSDSSSDSDLGKSLQEEDVDDMEKMLEEQYDLELLDAEEFLRMLGMNIGQQQTPQLTNEDNIQRNVIESSALSEQLSVEKATFLTPEVYWSQTDQTVKLKIKLIGVDQYKANVIQKKIFTFSTNLEGKNYELKFTLHKPAEMGKHRAHGQEVHVFLNKVESLEWLQLTGGKKRMRYIHYEIPDAEEKKPRKKFLQLDITDDESDDADGEKPMIHEISDLDSEFDEEVWSESDSS